MDPRAVLEGFANTRVLVVGDIMLDAYLWGRVDRISPEAPVPVVQVTERSERLGGAANVVLNLHALGAHTTLISLVGDDAAAGSIERLMREKQLTTAGILRSSSRRTTVKTRIISAHQHVVRVDEEMESDIDLAEEDQVLARVKEAIDHIGPGVVILEDYNKGVLTERVIKGVIAAAKAKGIPVAVDPKHRNFFSYVGVDLFKPNLKELREGLKVGIDAADIRSVRDAVQKLEGRLGNRISLITLSEHGIYAHDGSGEHVQPAYERVVADVSGAGDTVIAVASLCLALGLPLNALATWANLAGGLVCEEVGVVPIDRERLLEEALRTART